MQYFFLDSTKSTPQQHPFAHLSHLYVVFGFYKYHTQGPLGDPLQLTRNTHFVAHGSFAHLHIVSDKPPSSSFLVLLRCRAGEASGADGQY